MSHGRYQPEIERIVIRYVKEESFFWRSRNDYYPSCRRHDHTGSIAAVWNIRYYYKSIVSRGGGQSFYWCDLHLPDKYRTVADSMIRGKEKARVLQGEKLEGVAPHRRPRRTEPVGVDRVPWKSLL